MDPLVLQGLLLGWSVAWPPGPINAEMLRRVAGGGGFLAGWVVGLGACTGDFLWALAVGSGARVLLALPIVGAVLGWVSLALLLFLAFTFLRGAVRMARAPEGAAASAPAKGIDSRRGGFVLGLVMALTSPWNLAFWLAVIGGGAAGEGSAWVLAASVIAGALAWTVLYCGAMAAGARWMTPRFQVVAQGATGLLLLGFAVHRLLGV